MLTVFTNSHCLIWYVTSSSDQPCPLNTTACHLFSFYVENKDKYFVADTTFIFMGGEHILNLSHQKHISNANNLTLTGSSTDHSKIRCVSGKFGLLFENSSSIVIDALTIVNCGANMHHAGITITNVQRVRLNNITFEEMLGISIEIEDVTSVTISNALFVRNGHRFLRCSNQSNKKWQSYDVYITSGSSNQLQYNITNTVFSGSSRSELIGGGLFIKTVSSQSTYVSLKRCQFEGIISCQTYAANIDIVKYSQSAVVEVSDSFFLNNTNGGALSISTIQSTNVLYRYQYGESLNKIEVCNSLFQYNKAQDCAGISVQFTNAYTAGRVLMRNNHFVHNCAERSGGGICIVPTDTGSKSNMTHLIDVLNSRFERNVAKKYGAALFISSQWNSVSSYNITLSRCTFESNAVLSSYHQGWGIGGTAMISMAPHGNTFTNQILVSNCSFVKNQIGPSLYLTSKYSRTKNVLIGKVINCTFDSNYIKTSSALRILSTDGFRKIFVSSCLFQDNVHANVIMISNILSQEDYFILPDITLTNVIIHSSRSIQFGCIFLECDIQMLVKIHNISIHDNNGTGLASLNCALRFDGYNVVANNTATLGGGLIINGTGYALTSPNAIVLFKNNRAVYGGALYSGTHVLQHHLPRKCTFVSLNAIFVTNKATIAGDNLYGGIMSECRGFNPPRHIRSIPCKKYSNSTLQIQSNISSNPYSVFICNNNEVQHNTRSTRVSVFPGQYFTLPLITAGYCDGVSPGVLKISYSKVKIIADVQSQQTHTTCTKMRYKLLSVNGSHFTSGRMNVSVAQHQFHFQNQLKVYIQILHCPYGMQIRDEVCECNEILTGVNGIQCNISHWPNPILKESNTNVWLGYNKHINCTVVDSNCPFDYCSLSFDVHLNLNNSADQQCNQNRTGTLCGQCQNGLSLMLGSNACKMCTNKYLFILIVCVIAGILLIVFLTGLNMTVSDGKINGLLFYANVIKLNETVFFPKGYIPVISHFISWLNLDLGFEVCFFNGLNGYWKTWIQFLFPIYIWLLTILIIVSSQHSIRISRYLGYNIISVLSTLTLMSFTKILRNISNALMVTKLQQCGKNQLLVWSIDGNINYMSINHSTLAAFSIIILIFCVLFICIVSLYRWLQRFSNKFCSSYSYTSSFLFRLQPFLDTYSGPYNDKYYNWPGLLLLIRLIFTFIFTYTSGSVNYVNNYIIILCEVTFILSVLRSRMYRSRTNYWYEKIFHFNLFILCSINSLMSQSRYKQHTSIVTACSIAIALFLFIVMVLQQIYNKYLKKLTTASIPIETQPLLFNIDNILDNSESEVVCRRDSMIFDVQ